MVGGQLAIKASALSNYLAIIQNFLALDWSVAILNHTYNLFVVSEFEIILIQSGVTRHDAQISLRCWAEYYHHPAYYIE